MDRPAEELLDRDDVVLEVPPRRAPTCLSLISPGIISLEHYLKINSRIGGREVGPATQIRNLDWLHRLCNNDFVAVSNKTDRGKELVNQIPSQGWVHCRLAREIGDGTRTPGIGRWDVRGAIFRCMVVCDHCGLVQCNKRMWYALDTHGDRGHTCNNCRPSGRGKGR